MSSGGTVEAKENSQEDVLANKLDDGLASKPTTLWEYEHAAGKWVRYDDDLTEKLNKLTEDSLEIEMEEARLRLDLAAMKQLNLETGFKRNLRCVVRQDDNSSFSCWEIKKGRRYEPLSRDLQIIFEQAVTAKVTSIDYNGDKCDVDFETMVIVVKDVVTKFRRSVSLAESSFSAAPVLPARRTRALVKRSLNVDAMASTQLEEEDKEEEEDELPKKTRKSKVASGASTSKKSGSGRVYDPKRTMILKGRAPVDVECRQKMDEAHVYEEGNLVWDAMLNQTNVGNNNNKFYILQLLKDDETNNFSVWFRWGRVGYPGQNSLTPFGGNLEGAKHCFTTKFHDKTGNDWADKDNFETLPRKYTLIHMDYSVKRDEAPEEDIEAEDAQGKSPPPESKLDKRIQELLKLICNIQAMEETAMQLEFDSTRSPLGKLTRHQIAEGYRILGELEKQIREKKFGGEFVYLVNEYYTKIPHNFGFQQPPLIKTVEMLKKETDLLQVLEDIEIAVKSFGEAKKTGEKLSTVDKYYKNLHCDVSPVEKGSSEHQMIEKYMKLTHGDTHMYSMKITNIYQIERHTETERFKKDIGNRKLLWHGSRTTNFYGILSQGLRIAPPEAPVCGYMFGKGIYFADMASKSGNYCFPAPGKPGLLLLCEVALGESNELYQSDYHADKLPAGKHSTKGIGRTYPNEKEYFELEDGTVVPCGKPTQFKSSTANCSLLYNEYIVYSVDQVRIRYLVEVEFDM